MRWPPHAATRRRGFVQIGDGAGAFRAAPSLALWGVIEGLRLDPAFARFDAHAPSYLALYELVARAAPGVQLAQINAVDDAVQRRYLGLRGNPDTRVHAWLERNLSHLRAVVPGFRTFTMPGADHTILLRPQFYSAAVAGVRLRDWIAALLAGGTPDDVGTALLTRE